MDAWSARRTERFPTGGGRMKERCFACDKLFNPEGVMP